MFLYTVYTFVVQYDVSRSYEEEFMHRRSELGMLFSNVMELLKAKKTSLDDLKSYLSFSYPECSVEVENAKSVSKVLEVVRAYTSLDNIHRLEAIVIHCQLEGGNVLIKQYKESIEQFCKDIPIRHAYGQSLMDRFEKHLLKSETIVFVLQWDNEDKVLHDVRGLFPKAFGRLADDIEVNVVFKSDSIHVVCYAPSHLHGVLTGLVQDNEVDLMKEKIISITIGGCLILQREKEKVSMIFSAFKIHFIITILNIGDLQDEETDFLKDGLKLKKKQDKGCSKIR